MRISEIYKRKKTVVSFEVFPPKKTDAPDQSVYETFERICALSPDFVSVTCGAGGTGAGGNKTIELSALIKSKYGVEPMAHLTCIAAKKSDIKSAANEMKARGIENVLALRGDIPDGFDKNAPRDYTYAKELIADINREGFCTAGAAYPEGHINCIDDEENIEHLKQKQDAGAAFFTTQLCFSNDCFYKFLDLAAKRGIKAPISAGIMPMMGRSQIERMIFMCGASLPSKMIKLLNKYGENADDLLKAGLEYAKEQIDGLLSYGANGIHIYTMNRPQVAEFLAEGLL